MTKKALDENWAHISIMGDLIKGSVKPRPPPPSIHQGYLVSNGFRETLNVWPSIIYDRFSDENIPHLMRGLQIELLRGAVARTAEQILKIWRNKILIYENKIFKQI